MARDKQLAGIKLKSVLEKRRLGQALNAKEFAVLTGISYSTSREWFHIQNFPAFNGVIFWEDFVLWRQQRTGIAHAPELREPERTKPSLKNCELNLPAKARNLLSQA
jgi:hypothetical protein